MKTVILHNIVSSNTVYKINSYITKHKNKLGETTVWFSSQTESNRRWKLQEKPKFKYKILSNFSIKLKGKDLFTYFINPSIIKELKRLNPDRIIICGWDIFMYQASFVWGYLNKKHITLWSGSTISEKSWRRTLTKPLVKFFVKISTDFIAYGTRAKEYLISLGGDKNNVEIFINDVNKKYFVEQSNKWQRKKQSIKHKYGIKTNKNLILVGQLIERKGILDLLSAYKIFKKTHPQWGLIIVGYGQLDSKLKQIIKQEKLKNVYRLGFIEQYDLPQIYAVSNVLALPSHEEVWGLVVNEALHSGLKVVVGDKCGCVPDLIKPGLNGYIFKSGNVQSLTDSLIQAINKTPFFSVITCTKNMDQFVLRNLTSVKKQTFKDVEHILIDGYSTDNTPKILQKYKNTSDYPVIIHQAKPKGISHAMNQGVEKAKGRYLIHLHADDYFFNKNVLEKVHNFLTKHPKLDWIYGQIQTVEENTQPIGIFPRHKLLQLASPTLLKYINFIPHQAVFIKKEVFDKNGIFNKKLTSNMDLDYWLRIKDKTNWQFYPLIVSNFTIRPEAQSSGKKLLVENQNNHDLVLKNHLSKSEYLFSNVINNILLRINTVFR